MGGRAHTDLSLGVPFDAGAKYLHWAERNPLKRLADEGGIPLEDDDVAGPFLAFRNGQRLSDEEAARRRAGYGAVSRYLAASDGADGSLAEAVRGAPAEVADAARRLARMALGEEPERVSARDYDQLWAGDDYVVPSGYGALVAGLGADLPVRLDTPVTRIRWEAGGAAVEARGGTLRAAAAIVTVPVGVLKRGGLRWSPELPAHTQAALDGLHMGALTKVALRIDRARLGEVAASDFTDLDASGAGSSPCGRTSATSPSR